MLIYLGVVIVKVLAELGYDGTVREGYEFGVDFVDARPELLDDRRVGGGDGGAHFHILDMLVGHLVLRGE